MFFFNEIGGLVTESVELNFTIKRNGDKLIVSVLPKIKDLKDDAAKKIIPIVVSGTIDELDKGFSAAISTPIQSVTGLLTNMKDFEKASETASKNSKSSKADHDKAKKQADDNKKKFDQLVKKAEEFEKAGKLRDTIACLKQAIQYATNKQVIEVRIKKLSDKLNTGSLFEETEEPVQENYLDHVTQEEHSEEEDTDVDTENEEEE